MSREFVFERVNDKRQLINQKASHLNAIYYFTSAIYLMCVQVGSLYYSLLANTIFNRQIYSTTAIKSGCVIA